MSNFDETEAKASVPHKTIKRHTSTKLRQTMLRIKPELYSALEVIVVGRNICGSDGRKDSVSYILSEIVEKHEAEIMNDAANYARMTVVQSKMRRLPNGLLTRKRPNE